MQTSSRPPRRAAALKKKLASPVEGSHEAVLESENEVVPTPKKGGKKKATALKAAVIDPSKATRSARAKRTRSGEPKPDSNVIAEVGEDAETPIKAPTRRGKRAPLGEAKLLVLEDEEEDGGERVEEQEGGGKVEEQEGGELLQEQVDNEGEQHSEKETPMEREPTEEPVGQIQQETTHPSRLSRQTTPVSTLSRTLPQGTPKPKQNMRTPGESHMVAPTSDNKRTLEEAFPEGTGSTPERRRPASVAFPEGEDYTPIHQRSPLIAGTKVANFAGSPSRQVACGSPSRMRRSATPQVIGPLSPRPTQHILQAPPHTQHPTQQVQQPPKMKPRTVITHLIMTNFKSYAGRRVVGPFHPSFSSVVGPNGSGKSNVIDSLLFVFGFRASKMRQGKISALIHNSASHIDLQSCEVEVHFQEILDLPKGGHEVVPNSTLVIARRAFKNNSSKYSINGRESNFTQVTALLRDRGVDLDHKRFLILQGEVESIAQMKAKGKDENDDGLLEYLEDIIGTSKYKQPIEDSAQEVEGLNEVCLEKSTRVQHVEKEKDSLEDKKNSALTFIKDENELACKQATLYQVHKLECADHINVTSEMLTQLQAELDEELEKHKGNEEGMKTLEKKFKDMTREIETIERDTAIILKEQKEYDKENVKIQERKKFLANKEKKLQKAITTSRLSTSEATGMIEKHQSDLERLASEVATMETRLKMEEEELESVRNELKGKTQSFSDQITQKQKQLEPWNEKINQKQSAIAVAQSELDILRQKQNAAQKSIEEFQAKIELIQESRSAKELEYKECRAEKIRLEKDVQKTELQLEKVGQQEMTLRNMLSGARQKADEAKASLAASQNQGSVLAGLMRLKESGRVDGFHNRLGNLGTIDTKYDVAISTACPGLDSLVVDSVDVGQQCIEYLRKHNLGRAHFICLDRLPRRDMGPIKTPEDAPRLFDLVKPRDSKFAQAFYNNLTDTLVAKDLAQANRIAFGAKRWRVVTLDGQLIDTSGTMSGGGTRVIRGKMSSKQVAETTREAVTKLETEREAQEKNFQAFLDEKRALQERLKELQGRIPELDVTMSKIQLEVQSGERQVVDAERRIQELNGEHRVSTTDKNRVTALEKQIQTQSTELAELKVETSSIEDEIKALQDKIMEIGGVRLRSQKAIVDGLREQIETVNQQHMQAEIAKTKAEKAKVKVEKAFKDSTDELETVTRDMEGLDQEIKDQAKAVEEVKARVKEAQHFLEVKKDELGVVKEELDTKKKEMNETRAVEIEMRNKLEQHQKSLTENQKRYKHWEEKFGKLTLHQLADLDAGVDSGEALKLPQFTDDELRDIDKDELKKEVSVIEESLQNVNVDLSVLEEYRRRVAEHTARAADLNEAVAKRDSAKTMCDDLRKRRLEEFMEGFSTISLRLKEMYQMITMGGNAELELVDSLDPFSEGILFSVMPPKKSWKNISNLSGGEKTLSSLALVFALHHYKPTPLYVMDEIDAALDFRNVSIVASYIKERTKNAQFIVISLRNNMFELASRLVGVYKVNHMTKSITIENRDYLNENVNEKSGGYVNGSSGKAEVTASTR